MASTSILVRQIKLHKTAGNRLALFLLSLPLIFGAYTLRGVVLSQEWWRKETAAAYTRFQNSEALFNSPTHGIAIIDNGGVVLEWNKGMENLTGYSRKEILGQSFDTVVPQSRRFRYSRGFRSLLMHAKGDTESEKKKNAEELVIGVRDGVLVHKDGGIVNVSGRVFASYSLVDDYSYATVQFDRREDIVQLPPAEDEGKLQ